MQVILNISFYGAAWGGSFIPSLIALEKATLSQGASMVFVFPKMGQQLEWAKKFPNAIYMDNDFFLKRNPSLKYVQQLYTIIKHYNITHVVTNFIGYNVNLWVLKKIVNMPFTQVVHNTFHRPSPNKLKCYAKLKLLEQTYDKFVGVSEWAATSLKNNGLNSQKVTYVTNAIDMERLKSWEKITLKKSKDEYVVFMLGWPYYVKGVDLAIRAIKHLRMEGHNIVLVTPHHNIKHDLLTDLGEIPSFLRFVPAREDIATYYNACDLFLSASREEGYSYGIVEATVSNCVVLSSNISAPMSMKIPKMIFFESGNVEDLIDKIKYCMLNKEQNLSFKSKQRDYILQEFSMNEWAINMLNNII